MSLREKRSNEVNKCVHWAKALHLIAVILGGNLGCKAQRRKNLRADLLARQLRQAPRKRDIDLERSGLDWVRDGERWLSEQEWEGWPPYAAAASGDGGFDVASHRAFEDEAEAFGNKSDLRCFSPAKEVKGYLTHAVILGHVVHCLTPTFEGTSQ